LRRRCRRRPASFSRCRVSRRRAGCGVKAVKCEITDEISKISIAAAKAVGGGVVAVDVFETDNGLQINEVNYTMEFKNSIDITGVNIPGHIADYVIKVGKEQSE
jgi:[lysine-biosynthesis-protein LysW]--L-2-aminoadipate ligase